MRKTNAEPQNHFLEDKSFDLFYSSENKIPHPLQLSVIPTLLRLPLEKVSQLKPWLLPAGTFGLCTAWEYS